MKGQSRLRHKSEQIYDLPDGIFPARKKEKKHLPVSVRIRRGQKAEDDGRGNMFHGIGFFIHTEHLYCISRGTLYRPSLFSATYTAQFPI